MAQTRVWIGIVWALTGICLADAPAITPSAYWKNQVAFQNDPFCSYVSAGSTWIKFTILAEPYDPSLVYFQDSKRLKLHYDFASKYLDPFKGMSSQQFYAATVTAEQPSAVLGTVLLPPTHGTPPVADVNEYGIQFVRYDREQIRDLFAQVKASVIGPSDVRALFFPTFEQQAAAQADRAWFEAQGIPVGSMTRWAKGNTCYSQGWALGRLKVFTADRINTAYQAGELGLGDILLTDGVPAEIPLVAGVLSLAPSTPNSHVAILSRTYSSPFVYLAVQKDADLARSLAGHRVILTAYEDASGTCQTRLMDIEGQLDDALVAEVLKLKKVEPLQITPMAPYGAYCVPTEGLTPSDAKYVGGKAAGFGILRAAVPANSPKALALTFDLWNAFLDQPVDPDGGTLRNEINRRLSPYDTYPPADLQALSQALAGIRTLFTSPQITQFRADLQAAVLAMLKDPVYGFDPNIRLRFRSSTNVEDSAEYTGAGLYDSFSGCPADDLDADDKGPCRCDPNETSERGAFRAIRRTFASFYNDNAFLERLHRDINEAQVGMAVVVHPSFPDEIEMANGVATVDTNEADGQRQINLVTQSGATSVTNPADGSIPEEVSLDVLANGTLRQPVPADIQQTSSLVRLGGTVMTWSKDYKDLAALLIQVSDGFKRITGKTSYILDIEYKKVAPGDETLPSGGMVIKQVRQVPEPNQTPDVTPFLVNVPMDFEVFTGECKYEQDTIDVFAAHRLKSRWHLETRNMALDAGSLRAGIYGRVTIEALDEDHTCTASDVMGPLAGHGLDGTTATDTWRWADLANPRTIQLLTQGVRTVVSSAENPIFILTDFGIDAYTPFRVLAVNVTYDKPVTAWSPSLTKPSKYKDSIYLWPCQAPDANDLLQERTVASNGITIHTSYYYPPPPIGWASWVGTTAPLKRWKRTVIEGLTIEPIVLEGYWSQTYRPTHHNIVEHLLFEPRLEPGISPTVLEELKGKDIRFIHAIIDHQEGGQSALLTYGFDAVH